MCGVFFPSALLALYFLYNYTYLAMKFPGSLCCMLSTLFFPVIYTYIYFFTYPLEEEKQEINISCGVIFSSFYEKKNPMFNFVDELLVFSKNKIWGEN